MRLRSLCLLLGMVSVSVVRATPSTEIWIPSTDIQPYLVPHLNVDAYWREGSDRYFKSDKRDPNMYDVGPTIGILPFHDVQAEVGFDYLWNGTAYDRNPIYFNAKLGTPEGTLFANSPALAAGVFNVGTDWHPSSRVRTDQNIVYALASKVLPEIGPLPALGRVTGGCYLGNASVMTDRLGDPENKGLMLAWDRTMSELTDKLSLLLDYMGGDNAMGGFSIGAAWAFTANISLLVGYDWWNDQALAGANASTTQIDINF